MQRFLAGLTAESSRQLRESLPAPHAPCSI
jgi:hypothetical protein